jgi:hypothetical protein
MAGFAMVVVVVGGKRFFVKMKDDRDTKSSCSGLMTCEYGAAETQITRNNAQKASTLFCRTLYQFKMSSHSL